jgi:hypothetical protein
MAEVMDVFVVTCLSSLELTIKHHARDPIPALDAQNFCGHRPRSPLSPQAAPLSRTATQSRRLADRFETIWRAPCN